MLSQVVMIYPQFYILIVDDLFFSTAYVDFIEGGIGGIGKDFHW